MANHNDILSIDDLEKAATDKMDRMTRGYFNAGADGMVTLRDNISSFDKYKLRPRVLRDVSKIDPSSEFLGRKIAFPLCIAPTAMQKLAHLEGEIATIRAAMKRGVAMGLSSFSTTSLEDVVQASEGKVDITLQLYVMQNRRTSEALVRRAEKAGLKAIFLTVDTPYLGRRFSEIRNKFALPPHLTLGNFKISNYGAGIGNRGGSITEKLGGKPKAGEESEAPHHDTKKSNDGDKRAEVVDEKGLLNFGVQGDDGEVNSNDASLSWADIVWLRSITSLPIYLKGILTSEDTHLAIQHGIDGIIVSNHGGRQLDSTTSTLDALPEIVDAANGRIPVHIDGGIRRGSDIFKAIALGAECVWIGRIPIWGLAYNGQEGVDLALKILYEEFVLCMGLAGCRSVNEISRQHLARVRVDGTLSRL